MAVNESFPPRESGAGKSPKRIVVVDDHDVVRQGVRLILKGDPQWEVVGEATDGADALEKIETLQPDLVILDISMPRKGGLDVIRELHEKGLRPKILVLTMHESKDLAERVQESGAAGFVVKTSAARDLVPAMKTIFRDQTFFPS
jgi:DNA-binding NarL/FixJ family response regulator